MTLNVGALFPRKAAPLFRPCHYKVMYGGRGGAKCLALGTRVIMADGSLRVIERIIAIATDGGGAANLTVFYN